MSLTWNAKTGAFFFRAKTAEQASKCKAIGMDRSLPASRPGEDVYFTRDHYAALPLWEDADAGARQVLAELRAAYEESLAQDWDIDYPCPPGLAYRPFQRAGIHYAMSRAHCLIGDEPGLGKTIQAIGVANAMDAKRVLIVCPANVRLHWRDKIREWSIMKRPTVYPVIKSADGINPHAHFSILSYDLVRNETLHKLLKHMDFDLLVLDEGHYLKTWDAQRTRAIFGDGEALDERFLEGLAPHAEKILALTGTPLPNRPRECYTLARHLAWDAIDWMSEEKFKWTYNPSMTMPSGRVMEETGRLPELRCRLRCNFMVRRYKRDVLKDLPEKQYELAYLDETGDIRKALHAEKMLDIDPTDLRGASAEDMGHISTVRKMMGLAKVPRVLQHIAMLLDGGVEKLVVFAHHREVVAQLEDALRRFGVVAIHGGVSTPRREMLKQRFIKDPEVRVFLANLQAGGVGVDGLQQVASHVVFAEASWTPGDNEQAVDRLHRDGQRAAVLAQFTVVEGSFDEKVLGTAVRKQHVLHDALDNHQEMKL